MAKTPPSDPEADVPNLDCLETNDLREFALRHQAGAAHKKLFPKGGPGTQIATKDLANYAWNHITARRLRLEGRIEMAQQYESIADRIYQALPSWARW